MIACLASNGDEGGLKKSQRFDIETHDQMDQMGKKFKKILSCYGSTVANVGGWIWDSSRDRVGLGTEEWVGGGHVHEPPKKF